MIDWDKISSVFLDMDGTLLDLHFDNYFWMEYVPNQYAEQNNLSLHEAKAILYPRFQSMEGRLEWYCLDYWSTDLDLNIIKLKREMADRIKVLPYVVDCLSAIRKMGKRLILVTNAHPESLGLKMEKTCLSKFFDRIICSHDLELAKENHEFWVAVEEMEPFNKNCSLLVDDSISVLQCARKFGIEYLIAVAKPDSSRPIREIKDYLVIHDFRELLPVSLPG